MSAPRRWLERIGRWLRAVSIDQWRAIDAETEGGPTGRVDGLVLAVLVTVAVSLTLQEYYGQRHIFGQWFGHLRRPQDEYWQLKSYAWWSGARVVGYVILPMAVLALYPGQRLRDYYMSFRGFFRHLWIYVVLFLAVSPAVYLASRTPSFRETYPFYSLANRSALDFWTWELLYAAQFLSLEFFFRGFLLQGLRRAMGANAIFVMIVPYCMIHFQKPVLETLGAIGAGLILGTLAMRTRSIWGGVLIHVGVALSMDLLAMEDCRPGDPCDR